MARYREVEERHVHDDGPGGPVGRPYYANPAAWVIGLLIVLLLILLLVFGLGRAGDNDGGPVVREPARQAPVDPGGDTGGDTGGQQEGGADAEGGGTVEGGGEVGTPGR